MWDGADPHARERALTIAHENPPPAICPDQALAEIRDVIDSIGDTCPESARRSLGKWRYIYPIRYIY
jgi:hypothetical protein